MTLKTKLTTAAATGLAAILGLTGCGSNGGSGGGGLADSGDQEGGSGGPIELIVPFDPGGGADFAGRTIAQFLEPEVGESVTVVNTPGAGGQIGATELSTMAADGQAVGLMSNGILTTLPLTRDTQYDLESFEVIGEVAVSRQVLQVKSDAEWQTVDDVVAYAEKNPGEFTYGTSGVGSTAHLAMAMFLHSTGIEAEHVVYDGLGAAKSDVMGGNIDAAVGPVTDTEEGRLRPVVSFSAERGETSEDIPMLDDSGYEATMDVVHYLVAPASTPESTITHLEEGLKAAAENPETAEAFGSSELEVSFADGETSLADLKADLKRTTEVVDELGIEE